MYIYICMYVCVYIYTYKNVGVCAERWLVDR